jgi:hypothetical protein
MRDKFVQKRLDAPEKEYPIGSVHKPTGGKVFRNFRNQKGKSIGLVIQTPDGIRVFWKSVERAKHFHRNHRAWAIASSVVDELQREKVDVILLDVKEEGPIQVDMSTFLRKSIIDQFHPYEEQHFLHEHWWVGFDPESAKSI